MNCMLPKRRKHRTMNVQAPDRVICPGQGKYVRGFECVLIGKRGIGPLGTGIGVHECEGRMEAHHDPSRGAGGGDHQQVPLCAKGHRNVHDGCSFEGVSFSKIGAALWKQSPHRLKFEREWKEQWPGVPLPYVSSSSDLKG